MTESISFFERILMYMDQSPFWVLCIIFAIIFIILFFILREVICWVFKINERIEIMEEQRVLLAGISNNLYILTKKSVGSGLNLENENRELENEHGESTKGGAGQNSD